jgi:translation initiation factor 1
LLDVFLFFIRRGNPRNSAIIRVQNMAKKINNLEDLGGFVFSTNKDFEFDSESGSEEMLPPGKQRLEAHLDKKNRGGKIATVIKGFQGSDDDLKTLGKLLKTKCGVGGAVKDNEIIIQGNFRDKVMQILQNEGYSVKRVGS